MKQMHFSFYFECLLMMRKKAIFYFNWIPFHFKVKVFFSNANILGKGNVSIKS